MNAQPERDYSFAIGLLTGTIVGLGLAMWCAPRFAWELRERMSDSAKRLSKRASSQYQQASSRAAEAVDEIARRGQDVRDDVAGAVARGAHEVERYATLGKSGRGPETRKQSAAERSAAATQSL
jgi:gas vesicle protein